MVDVYTFLCRCVLSVAPVTHSGCQSPMVSSSAWSVRVNTEDLGCMSGTVLVSYQLLVKHRGLGVHVRYDIILASCKIGVIIGG